MKENNNEINTEKYFEPLPDPNGTPSKLYDEGLIKNIVQTQCIENDKPSVAKSILLEKTLQRDDSPIATCGSREFVIGDLHFYHKAIIHSAPRDFDGVDEMNQFMIDQWNSVVTNNDTVFVLGDFFDFDSCTDEEMCSVLDNLQGNIILIAGNHDRGHLDRIRNYGIEAIEYPIVKDGFWFLSHEPMYVSEAAPYANIFAHVHLNPMYRTVSSRSFCASAERHNYMPVLLSEAKRLVRECAG